MPKRYKQGSAGITLDDDALVRTLDKVASGLPSAFIRETSTELAPIMAGAEARWPVRYRRSRNSRGSFRLFHALRGNQIEAGIENTARGPNGRGYAWFVRYSRRDRASLARELAKVEGIATEAERYASSIQAEGVRLFAFLDKSRELAEDASITLPPLRGTRSAAGLVKLYRDNLFTRHGEGAVTKAKAGKSIWAAFVRTPGRRAAKVIAERLQDDLSRAARS
jgi:hypothetical protein